MVPTVPLSHVFPDEKSVYNTLKKCRFCQPSKILRIAADFHSFVSGKHVAEPLIRCTQRQQAYVRTGMTETCLLRGKLIFKVNFGKRGGLRVVLVTTGYGN